MDHNCFIIILIFVAGTRCYFFFQGVSLKGRAATQAFKMFFTDVELDWVMGHGFPANQHQPSSRGSRKPPQIASCDILWGLWYWAWWTWWWAVRQDQVFITWQTWQAAQGGESVWGQAGQRGFKSGGHQEKAGIRILTQSRILTES